jgi:hypothetical protein
MIIGILEKCNWDADLAILTLLNEQEDESDFVKINKEDESNSLTESAQDSFVDEFDDEQVR